MDSERDTTEDGGYIAAELDAKKASRELREVRVDLDRSMVGFPVLIAMTFTFLICSLLVAWYGGSVLSEGFLRANVAFAAMNVFLTCIAVGTYRSYRKL